MADSACGVMISEHPYESFRFQEGGILMECQVEYTGYCLADSNGPIMVPTNEEPAVFSLAFTISKT